MGARGPKPTPTATLKLRGSWLAKQREKQGEIQPLPGKPRPPVGMGDKSGTFYRRLVNQLSTVPGLLSRVDAHSLARYATLLARYWDAEEKVAKFGEVMPVKDKDGNVVGMEQSAYSSITLRLAEKLIKLEAEFGLTPSARSRIRLGDSVAGAATRANRSDSTCGGAIVRTRGDFIA